MNRQTLKRLAVKGTVAYVAVFSLVLMVAMPAMALIAAANSVNSRAIINRQVKSRDIAKGAVRSKNIANKAVKHKKIANNAVRTKHIKDGAVTAAKINSAGLNADTLDGAHASAFAGAGHNHGSQYVGKTGNHTMSGELTAAGMTATQMTAEAMTTDVMTATAMTATDINYDSPKTGYLSIPASALVPYEDGYDYKNASALFMEAGGGFFKAPVYLPQGAVVTKLRYYCKDNTASGSTKAELYRVDNLLTWPNLMAETGYPSDDPAWQEKTDTVISFAAIDNSSYAYYVKVTMGTFGAELLAGNMVIEYTYTSPGS